MHAIPQDQLTAALVHRGLLEANELEKLKREARKRRVDLLNLIMARFRLPMTAVYRAMAEMKGVPFVDFTRQQPNLEIAKTFPISLIKRGVALPIAIEQNVLSVACTNTDDHLLLAEIERRTSLHPKAMLAEPAALTDACAELLGQLDPNSRVIEDEDPVVILDRVMKEAFLRRASDIHFDPQPDSMLIRLRIEGRLQNLPIPLSERQSHALVSRVKVLSGLDIAEQRAAQDGGMTYHLTSLPDTSIDLRVATIATKWGERVTIRLLAQESKEFTLNETGMTETALKTFRRAIRNPYGMVLITGPTGSGKSTTLYAALREIRRPEVNVMTLEDPVESNVRGISQIQVDSADKITFAKGLRSLLRHDPDVIMVGEIRDYETAEVALRSAMTGHLMFSTLHTNDAPSAVTRLKDIGCEPYLIASTLLLVVAQRLVRKLCGNCKISRPPTPNERTYLGLTDPDAQICAPSKEGCSRCVGTGFQGRIGVFELLEIDQELQRIIADQASQKEWQEAIATRRTALREDAFHKVLKGETTLEEVLGVTVA